MASACLTKQVHRLMKTVERRTDGQVTVLGFEPDVNNYYEVLRVAIEPNAGLYKGGRFRFSIQLPSDYPDSVDTPVVWCDSEVFHPNINPTAEHYKFASNVCVDIVKYEYQNCLGLEAVVQGLVFLMHYPNFEDPLADFFGSDTELDIENVRRYMAGEEIDGQLFALERAEKYKENKAEGSPEQTECKHCKEDTDVATVDETVENICNKDKDTCIANVTDGYEKDNNDNNDNENDVYTGGFELVKLDGEIILVPVEDTDLLDELTASQTAKDYTDNQTKDIAENTEPTTNAIDLVTHSISTETLVHQETNSKQHKDTNETANTFQRDQENSDHVTLADIIGDKNIVVKDKAMPANDKEPAGFIEDAEVDNEKIAFVQEKLKPHRLELFFFMFEKLFQKMLTNAQYIRDRFMGCLKRR